MSLTVLIQKMETITVSQKIFMRFSNVRNKPILAEKAMAPHSSTLAWEIPWTEEPYKLQSMGSLRVGHD